MPPGMQIQLRPLKLEIIIKDSIADLETEVSRRLENNWMLHGDWTVLAGGSKTQYAQAMVEMGAKPFKIPDEVLREMSGSGLLLPAGMPPLR